MAWSDILNAILGNRQGGNGATPPYIPQGPNLPSNTPGLPGAQQQGPSTLARVLPSIIGAGASVAGGLLQSNAVNNQNQQLQQRAAINDKLAQEEMARRNFYASILLPHWLQGMGNKDPGTAQAALNFRQSGITGLPGGGGTAPGAFQGGPGSPPAAPVSLNSFNNGIPPITALNPSGLPEEASQPNRFPWQQLLRM